MYTGPRQMSDYSPPHTSLRDPRGLGQRSARSPAPLQKQRCLRPCVEKLQPGSPSAADGGSVAALSPAAPTSHLAPLGHLGLYAAGRLADEQLLH